MFLAYSQQIPKKEETTGQKILNFCKSALYIGCAETVSYPFLLFRVRACSYPRKSINISKALIHQRLFSGLNISFQKSLFTFFMRSQIYQIYFTYLNKIKPQTFYISQQNEACILGGFLTGMMTSFWNACSIKLQLTPFSESNVRFISVLKQIIEQTQLKTDFSIAKNGMTSFCFINIIQSIAEFQIFWKLYENYSQNTFKLIFGTSLITTLLTSPIEFLNIRYCLRKFRGLQTPNFVKYSFLLAKKEGIFVFYRGFSLNFMRNLLLNFIIFKGIRNNYEFPLYQSKEKQI